MKDIAHDQHFHTFHLSKLFADRIRIQKRLRRMFVRSIAGVHDPGIHVAAQEKRGTRIGMAHHHHVHLHRKDIVHRIHQRFALAYAASAAGEVDHIGA